STPNIFPLPPAGRLSWSGIISGLPKHSFFPYRPWRLLLIYAFGLTRRIFSDGLWNKSSHPPLPQRGWAPHLPAPLISLASSCLTILIIFSDLLQSSL